MDELARVILLAVGLIHLLPVTGVFGGARLQRLYGVVVEEPTLAILLRHRAVLFGLIGLVLIAGALHEAWRGPALVAGLISTLSFILIARREGGGNAAVARAARIDVAASIGLLLVTGYDLYRRLLEAHS